MSSSLLSEPSTVKLLPRDRSPLTENCPADPTPGPTPGPATLPSVGGGGARPGSNNANSSNGRTMVAPPSGNVVISSALKDPLRRASTVMMPARMSVSSTTGAGVGAGATAGTGSNATGTGTTSPV